VIHARDFHPAFRQAEEDAHLLGILTAALAAAVPGAPGPLAALALLIQQAHGITTPVGPTAVTIPPPRHP
jgi:hypothetical protein